MTRVVSERCTSLGECCDENDPTLRVVDNRGNEIHNLVDWNTVDNPVGSGTVLDRYFVEKLVK